LQAYENLDSAKDLPRGKSFAYNKLYIIYYSNTSVTVTTFFYNYDCFCISALAVMASPRGARTLAAFAAALAHAFFSDTAESQCKQA
jgi:hypothetical protein